MKTENMTEQQINDEYCRQLYMVLYGPESWSPSNPKPEHMMEITQDMVDIFRSYVECPTLDKGPAEQVTTTEKVSVRIGRNQYGVLTSWVSGEDGQEYGCTHAGHEQLTAHWLVKRLLDSSRRSAGDSVPEIDQNKPPVY